MPTYKTHAIHITKCNDYIDKRIDLNLEDLKVFSFGPDSLVFTDPIVFNLQHNKDSRYFFMYLLNEIKQNHELENPELIAFLYGQISHYILDYTFHPYVYYLTGNMKLNKMIHPHMQLEFWIDNYIMDKYGIYDKEFFTKTKIDDQHTRQIIDKVYFQVYKCILASNKYDIGINALESLETNVRFNDISKRIKKLADLTYEKRKKIFEWFLNRERNTWLHPFNGEKHKESLNELWNNSVALYLETIEDVNNHLYNNKPLKNPILTSNSSYDTALDCESNKKLLFAKKYKKEVII
ncbi:MAG: zinc dependent phospholipase C family protein [Bacilli bacterium]|nr:zinc dependent phospholipase C family protein [Bacilli bacterium]